MAEVLNRFRPKIDASDVMDRLGLERDGFFVVSAHREENVDSPLKLRSLTESLQRLAAEFGFPVIVSTHPRTRKRLGAQPDHALSPLVRFLPPFGFPDYVKLQLGAYCVISDGGTITEEAALLDIPAVTVRDAHERPEGMDAGVLVRSSFASTVCPMPCGSFARAWKAAGSAVKSRTTRAASTPRPRSCGSWHPTSM